MKPFLLLLQHNTALALAAASILGIPVLAQEAPVQPQSQTQQVPSPTPHPQQQASPPVSATIQQPLQSSDIPTLAAELAVAIRKSHPAPATMAVMDFQGPQQAAAPFGVWLADQFSDALAKAMPEFKLIARAEEDALLKATRPPSYRRTMQQKEVVIAAQLHADLFVTANFAAVGSGIGISLFISETKSAKALEAPLNGFIPLTPEVEDHITLPLDSLRPTGGIFNGGSYGISNVACVYCPNPTYTQQAVTRRFSGMTLIEVVVGADGKANNIKLSRTSGDAGLDEKAVEIIPTWKFELGRDAIGTAVPVRLTIEVDFRLLK